MRFGNTAIRSSYLIDDNDADFIGCHQSVFLSRYNMLDKAAEGAVFLINSVAPPDQVWHSLSKKMQRQIIDKKITVYVIDALAVAAQTGMGKRINTVMQTCFFAFRGGWLGMT